MNMRNDRLNKKVFLWDKELCHDNWSSCFKSVLADLNLTGHMENSTIIPLVAAKIQTKETIKRDWEHHCLTKDKLRTYRTFKTEMSTASHLACNLPKFQRPLISQLRLGILPIHIETGRFARLNEEDRICQLCDSNDIENEAHFLFYCNLHVYAPYRDELETGIGAVFQNMTDEEKFCRVFNHPYVLGRYIEKAFCKRRENLYKR